MSEPTAFTFDYREIAALLVQKQEIHEGYWAVTIEFGLGAGNIGPSGDQLRPTAIIPILKIGIQRVDELTNLAVDAAVVNPAPTVEPKSSRKSKGKP
jgi:hypothetical protein